MSASRFIYDVFLSHSSKDKSIVRPLSERLRSDGLRVWFDEWEIKPGDSIPSKIEEGLEHSRVLLLCMSANAFGSDWAQLEAGTFRFRDPLNKDRRFIPLRLDDAPIKGSLAQFLHIDWTPPFRERVYTNLVESLRLSSERLEIPENSNVSQLLDPTGSSSDIGRELFQLISRQVEIEIGTGEAGSTESASKIIRKLIRALPYETHTRIVSALPNKDEADPVRLGGIDRALAFREFGDEAPDLHVGVSSVMLGVAAIFHHIKKSYSSLKLHPFSTVASIIDALRDKTYFELDVFPVGLHSLPRLLALPDYLPLEMILPTVDARILIPRDWTTSSAASILAETGIRVLGMHDPENDNLVGILRQQYPNIFHSRRCIDGIKSEECIPVLEEGQKALLVFGSAIPICSPHGHEIPVPDEFVSESLVAMHRRFRENSHRTLIFKSLICNSWNVLRESPEEIEKTVHAMLADSSFATMIRRSFRLKTALP